VNETKPKVIVLIPAHCVPKVLMMTIGTWLEHYDGSYDADVIVSVHDNYHHYHNGLDEIKALAGNRLRIVTVPELDWEEGDYWKRVMRYSRMHARCLLAMMEAAKGSYPDYVALLDHDLMFEEDFIGWSIRDHGRADIVGCFMQDLSADRNVKTEDGYDVMFAPKVSVWHLVMSSRMFECVRNTPNMMEPCKRGNKIYDTFSMGFEFAKTTGMDVRVFPEAVIAAKVRHLGSSSFNWGSRMHGQGYGERVSQLELGYSKRFPGGITELLGRLEGDHGK